MGKLVQQQTKQFQQLYISAVEAIELQINYGNVIRSFDVIECSLEENHSQHMQIKRGAKPCAPSLYKSQYNVRSVVWDWHSSAIAKSGI